MKSTRFHISTKDLWTQAVPALLFLCSFAASGATPGPGHWVDRLMVQPGQAATLQLNGTVPITFRAYFDLFPLETSEDLLVWRPLATVVRNNLSSAITYLDAEAANSVARFYRTPTNVFSTPFLAPTGPYPVGTLSRTLTDSTRTDRFGVRSNSSFAMTVWYPAQRRTGDVPTAYMDAPLAGWYPYWSSYTNRVPYLVSAAFWHALPASTPQHFPIVIYSHGLGDVQGRAVRTENTEKAVQLASHGFVVIAIDHTDAYATVLNSTQLVLGRHAWSFDYLSDRLVDVAYLLDLFQTWNAEDPLFQGRLDLERIGIMGWSFGGGTAAEACRSDSRLKATVILDGLVSASPTLMSVGLGKPFLSMNSGALIDENNTLFNKATQDAFILTIRNSTHELFTDNAWMIGPNGTTRRQATAMDACMISFFNKYLQGADDKLLENPTNQYPDVVSYGKK
jgi:dienelactone hydrolase